MGEAKSRNAFARRALQDGLVPLPLLPVQLQVLLSDRGLVARERRHAHGFDRFVLPWVSEQAYALCREGLLPSDVVELIARGEDACLAERAAMALEGKKGPLAKREGRALDAVYEETQARGKFFVPGTGEVVRLRPRYEARDPSDVKLDLKNPQPWRRRK